MNKIRHSKDATLERNNIQYGPFLIKEYNLTKAKKHPSYKFVQDFYKALGIQRQNFIKYYNRYNNLNIFQTRLCSMKDTLTLQREWETT